MSMELCIDVYKLTERFPRSELYGLTSQLRRSVVSIPSNLAEGAARQSKKEYVHFLYCALGSAAELETQLVLSGMLGFAAEIKLRPLVEKLTRVSKMLNGLIRKWK